MEKGQAEKGNGVVEDIHAPWLAAIAAHERSDVSSGWTRSPSMEKAEAEKGKEVVVAEEEEEEDHSTWFATIAAQESGVESACHILHRGAEAEEDQDGCADPVEEEEELEDSAARGEEGEGDKIWSPADVETFDESDSDDADEDSDDMADDDGDRDRKSRAVLKKLKDGSIPYLIGPGKYKCPWCFRGKMPTDHLGMLQHATYFGSGSEKHQAHLKAKHAAYGVFLLKHLPKP